ncbi:ArsR family transcriptional regulator [Ktedonosporobacter rubrisoli]|uniref:ArsR family transcriptional regulator n=1 Tax=Ktedonosporobacter rubrisoli TaxID=2509675 RepID=A0A4P6JLW5_KTERU|nr:winged helix-turn-helix domain-containing protein [Ktedonosporobacter rubrisoli]QBD76083.1 ArsR family transcriptional regulator [Ktedonosporobacter rubrisoli]
MPGDANIAALASLLADPTRVNILMSLSDGRALPAGELARNARVASSTASAHLARLEEFGLITVVKQGRHRYFRLTDPSITRVLEMLATYSPAAPIHSLRESEAARAIRRARMCYNHLAGALGVALSQSLVHKGILIENDDGYSITPAGQAWIGDFGLDLGQRHRHPVSFIPHHIDWSERRHHIAGNFGAAFARHFFAKDWIRRSPNSRAVNITEQGQEVLLSEFGLRWEKSAQGILITASA